MAAEFNKTPKKANNWFRVFIVLAILYGATFSLDAFFNWIFFFSAVYSLFMSYFLLPVQPKIFQGNQNRSRQSREWQMPGGTGGPQTQTTPQDRAKRVAIIISVSIGGLFFLLLLIGLLAGDPEEGQDSQYDSRQEEPYDMNTNPMALVDRGNEYYNDQQYDSAEIYYDKALALDNSNAYAIYGKAIVYDQKGLTSEAIDFYKESVGLDSTFTESYKRLAELEPEKSEAYLRLAEKYGSN